MPSQQYDIHDFRFSYEMLLFRLQRRDLREYSANVYHKQLSEEDSTPQTTDTDIMTLLVPLDQFKKEESLPVKLRSERKNKYAVELLKYLQLLEKGNFITQETRKKVFLCWCKMTESKLFYLIHASWVPIQLYSAPEKINFRTHHLTALMLYADLELSGDAELTETSLELFKIAKSGKITHQDALQTFTGGYYIPHIGYRDIHGWSPLDHAFHLKNYWFLRASTVYYGGQPNFEESLIIAILRYINTLKPDVEKMSNCAEYVNETLRQISKIDIINSLTKKEQKSTCEKLSKLLYASVDCLAFIYKSLEPGGKAAVGYNTVNNIIIAKQPDEPFWAAHNRNLGDEINSILNYLMNEKHFNLPLLMYHFIIIKIIDNIDVKTSTDNDLYNIIIDIFFSFPIRKLAKQQSKDIEINTSSSPENNNWGFSDVTAKLNKALGKTFTERHGNKWNLVTHSGPPYKILLDPRIKNEKDKDTYADRLKDKGFQQETDFTFVKEITKDDHQNFQLVIPNIDEFLKRHCQASLKCASNYGITVISKSTSSTSSNQKNESENDNSFDQSRASTTV